MGNRPIQVAFRATNKMDAMDATNGPVRVWLQRAFRAEQANEQPAAVSVTGLRCPSRSPKQCCGPCAEHCVGPFLLAYGLTL